MADWKNLVSPGSDFASIYTTRTMATTPTYVHHHVNGLHGNNSSGELNFSASPIKFDPDSPDRSSGMANGDISSSFCGRDNVDDCIAFLNQELTLLGMPSLYDGKSGTFDIVRLVNGTHDMLQKQQKTIRLREELENINHRKEADIEHLKLTQVRLNTSLEQCRRDLTQSQEKERQLNHKIKLLNNKLKAEKEEVRRLQSVIQHRDAQFKHEIKKKERETNRLKEKLHQLLSDRNQERKVGMQISQSLQRTDGKRGTWKTGQKHEEEMYRMVITDYEERQKELMVENTELRQCLNNMQKELVQLLNEPTLPNTSNGSQSHVLRELAQLSDSDDNLSVDSVQTGSLDGELSEGHFQMPYGIVRDGIEKSLKEKCKLLKRYIQKIEKQKGMPNTNNVSSKEIRNTSTSTTPVHNRSADEQYKKEIDRLNKQSERYKQIIEQQEEFIQENLDAQNAVAETSILRDSYLWDEWDSLQRDKKIVKQQRQHLQDERKTLKDSKKWYEKERRILENEKANLLQQQFMQMTPFNNNKTQHKLAQKSKPRRQRLLPSTPGYSPAQRVPVIHTPESRTDLLAGSTFTSTPANTASAQPNMPSTTDLYRTMGLITHDQKHCGDLSGGSSRSSVQGDGASPDQLTHSPSPNSAARINQHVENIKITLFNQQNHEDGFQHLDIDNKDET